MANWPGVARFTMRYTRTLGDDMVNVIHVRRDDEDTPTIAWMTSVAQILRDELWDKAAVTTDLRNYTANEVTLAEILGVSVDLTSIGLFSLLAVNQAGSNMNDPIAPQLAVVASHRTDFATRAGRGRTYHGGFTTTAQLSSSTAYPIVSAALLADLPVMWTRVDTALAALGIPSHHVIASEATQTAENVTSRKFPTKIYTQRRRN